MIKRNLFRPENFDTGHLIRDLIADDLVKYIMAGGDIKNIRRFFLRHRRYAPTLFIYLFRYDRTAKDIPKFRADLDFLDLQLYIIQDESLRNRLQSIHESYAAVFDWLKEQERRNA